MPIVTKIAKALAKARNCRDDKEDHHAYVDEAAYDLLELIADDEDHPLAKLAAEVVKEENQTGWWYA